MTDEPLSAYIRRTKGEEMSWIDIANDVQQLEAQCRMLRAELELVRQRLKMVLVGILTLTGYPRVP